MLLLLRVHDPVNPDQLPVVPKRTQLNDATKGMKEEELKGKEGEGEGEGKEGKREVREGVGEEEEGRSRWRGRLKGLLP